MNEIQTFYDQLIEAYGPNDPKALGWQTAESQTKRFQILSEIGTLNGASVLDVGCGVGDLYGYLLQKIVNFTYRGIDSNELMIQSAKSKYPGTEFILSGIAEYNDNTFDYVLSSGLLNLKIPNHRKVYFGYIMKMFDLSKIGLAFNMLNNKFHDDDETYAAYSVTEIYELCSTLSTKIVIRQDYLPHDFTIYLYH